MISKLASKKDCEYFGKDLEAMSFANKYHRWILSKFQPYFGSIVAEVGAGVGSFSRLILETSIIRLVAFEPSGNMFSLLEKDIGKNEKVETVNDFFGTEYQHEYFDSIIYLNVLEHIEDDTNEISKAYKALKKNGYLLVFVPALKFLYSDFDRAIGHFRRYTKKQLIEITRNSGFSIFKLYYFDIVGIVPWYINFTLFKNSINPNSVYLFDRIVVPIMRVIEGIKSPPVGKNLLLIAKK